MKGSGVIDVGSATKALRELRPGRRLDLAYCGVSEIGSAGMTLVSGLIRKVSKARPGGGRSVTFQTPLASFHLYKGGFGSRDDSVVAETLVPDSLDSAAASRGEAGYSKRTNPGRSSGANRQAA